MLNACAACRLYGTTSGSECGSAWEAYGRTRGVRLLVTFFARIASAVHLHRGRPLVISAAQASPFVMSSCLPRPLSRRCGPVRSPSSSSLPRSPPQLPRQEAHRKRKGKPTALLAPILKSPQHQQCSAATTETFTARPDPRPTL